MKVVLAEKPSVARDIAKVLNANQKRDGYFEGNNWAITWAFGHLVELKEPNEYDSKFKRWHLEDLPIIPEKFGLKAKGDKTAKKQLNTVKKLFKEADEIICATDAGREGELIFRYIQTWANCLRKPFHRLWINSLTKEAIQQGFRKLRDGHDFDHLYHAAKCRSEADWIVGINATRFYTVQFGLGNQLWSIGRVQTPVLAMIVQRDLEIKNFKPEDYWELHTQYRDVLFKHKKGKIKEKELANSLLEKVKPHELEIIGITKKQEKANPPLLYDLTDLQKDMNKRYGLTADQTLSTAQSLYEKKHLTYPRTDSRYLSNDIKPTIAPLLQKLKRLKDKEISFLDLNNLQFTKRIIDDKKITDHHAIIPTDVIPGSLQNNESKVYDAILTRFISVFYPPCLKNVTTVNAQANQEPFKASGTIIQDPGWQALYPYLAKKAGNSGSKNENQNNNKDNDQIMPDFQKGEKGPHTPEIKTLKTKAPRPHTEASLLNMMETAGKTIEEEELKEALKEKGIGTPATRASIIEVLIRRQYISRQRKNVVSTNLGQELISLIEDKHIKSSEMTGDWESKLKKIENGKYQAADFMKEIKEFTSHIVQAKLANQIDSNILGHCPLCQKEVIQGKKGYGCSGWKEGCKFVLWQEAFGTNINKDMAREILQNKRTPQFYLLKTEAGDMTGHILLNDKGEIGYEKKELTSASNNNNTDSIGPCPVCKGPIQETPKAYGCSNWRQGCKFVIWKTIAKKKVTKTMVKSLLTKGETGIVKGFKSKAGKDFDANLKIQNNEVKFDFDN